MQSTESSFTNLLNELNAGSTESGISIIEMDSDYLKSIPESSGNVILGLHDYYCTPAKRLLGYLKKTAEKYDINTAVGVVWFEGYAKKFAKHYGVYAIPAVLIFRDGKSLGKIIGIESEEDFFQDLEKVLGKT